jgi:hypothetical protein
VQDRNKRIHLLLGSGSRQQSKIVYRFPLIERGKKVVFKFPNRKLRVYGGCLD